MKKSIILTLGFKSFTKIAAKQLFHNEIIIMSGDCFIILIIERKQS